MSKPPSDTAPKIVIRVPDGLRERIAARAKESGRSVNAELVDLLEHSYPQLTPTPDLLVKAQKVLDRIGKHSSDEIGDEVRWALVSLINTAHDYGVLKSDMGYLEFERQMEREGALGASRKKGAES